MKPITTVPIKAITVSPVWAWAIIFAGKTVENRSWTTPHRGRLAIHAGLKPKTEADDRAFIEALGVAPTRQNWPRGVIVGIVDLTGCQPYTRPPQSRSVGIRPVVLDSGKPHALCEAGSSPRPAVNLDVSASGGLGVDPGGRLPDV